MLNLLDLKKQTTWIVIFIFSLIFIIGINSIKTNKTNKTNNNKENFYFSPWNMGTRFYPSYDLRNYPPMPIYNETEKNFSYPLIFPWNYPYPGLPYLYWSPYFYEANGKYTYNGKYGKSLYNTQSGIKSKDKGK